jgi:hypothetical protein
VIKDIDEIRLVIKWIIVEARLVYPMVWLSFCVYSKFSTVKSKN